MSNVMCIISRSNVTSQRIADCLAQACRETHPDLEVRAYIADFVVSFDTDDVFSVNMQTQRRVSSKRVRPDWKAWVQATVMDRLCNLLEGRMSDEGLPGERWVPKEWEYPTYRSWLQRVVYPGTFARCIMTFMALTGSLEADLPSGLRDGIGPTREVKS